MLPKSRLQKLNVCHTYHKYLAGWWSIKAGQSERKKCYEIFVIPQGTRISFCFALSRLSANVLRRCWSKKMDCGHFVKGLRFYSLSTPFPPCPLEKQGHIKTNPKTKATRVGDICIHFVWITLGCRGCSVVWSPIIWSVYSHSLFLYNDYDGLPPLLCRLPSSVVAADFYFNSCFLSVVVYKT